MSVTLIPYIKYHELTMVAHKILSTLRNDIAEVQV